MKARFMSFDSMGVRSMATFLETSGGGFFVDPGAALAPRRYGLPPHEEELKALEGFLDSVRRFLAEADYVIITHYHRDHYLFRKGEEEYYRGKVMFVKNPYAHINASQKIRAYILLKKMGVEGIARRVVFADGHCELVGDVKVCISKPLPHGECGTELGWVLAVTLEEDGFRFTHASDVQGCICADSLRSLSSGRDDLLLLSGPPTYLNPGVSLLDNTVKLVRGLKSGSTLIIDHHFLRDRDYMRYMDYLRRVRPDVKIMTAAEYMGVEVKQLEAYRDLLWGIGATDLRRHAEEE